MLYRSPTFPDHTFAVDRNVLNDPAPRSTDAPGSSGGDIVLIFTEAPKAPAPFVDVPAPRCICILEVEAARSGRSTQNTCCDSGSFKGMPSTVIFILFASVPRIRNEVYPIPLPASEVSTTEGVSASRYGMSRVMSDFLNAEASTVVCAMGVR